MSAHCWFVCLFALLAVPVHAETLHFSAFSTAFSTTDVLGLAYDATSGFYYAHKGNGSVDAPLQRYLSAESFAANKLAAGLWSRWEGSLQADGGSGLNLLQDEKGIYLLAAMDGNKAWTPSVLAADLSLHKTITTSIDKAGYAFLIDGYLFVSDSASSTAISRRIDVDTGEVADVSYSLDLEGAKDMLITSTLYDSKLDRLYVFNSTDKTMYSFDGAAKAFTQGTLFSPSGFTQVPEPSAWTLLTVGLLGLFARLVWSSACPRICVSFWPFLSSLQASPVFMRSIESPPRSTPMKP
ncbi:MAG: PEP-CTERM sorting domain-containing protein [Acidobacteriota bacterium]